MKKALLLSPLILFCTFTIYKYVFATSNELRNDKLFNPQNTISLQKEIPNTSQPQVLEATTEDESQLTTYEQINEEYVASSPHMLLNLQSSMDTPTSVPTSTNAFYLYAPEVVFTDTPVIIACHGISKDEEEMAGFGKGNFALYLKVYQGYHPNAVIVFPCKYENGDWKSKDVVNLTNSFIQTYQFSGPVYYYGFSQGCLNGPDIISQYGNFKAAVFVDEDFIATPYPDKDGTPLGIYRATNLLSSLSALRIAGCTYVDLDYDRIRFANLFRAQGAQYNEEIYPKNKYKHLEVHELTVVSNIEWLLQQ